MPKIDENYIRQIFPPAQHFGTIGDIVNVIVPTLLGGAGLIFFLMMIYAGFLYIGSQGNPETIKKIQKLLTWAVVGFVLTITSFIFVRFLFYLFNLTAPV